jgi:hypothetical protein
MIRKNQELVYLNTYKDFKMYYNRTKNIFCSYSHKFSLTADSLGSLKIKIAKAAEDRMYNDKIIGLPVLIKPNLSDFWHCGTLIGINNTCVTYRRLKVKVGRNTHDTSSCNIRIKNINFKKLRKLQIQEERIGKQIQKLLKPAIYLNYVATPEEAWKLAKG